MLNSRQPFLNPARSFLGHGREPCSPSPIADRTSRRRACAGARVQVENPPQEGATCLIAWQSNELFCRVVWTVDDMCGVMFERPISQAAVLVTLGEAESEAEPEPARLTRLANLRNIPIGKRRSHLRLVEND